jgi:hypothetical protein
LRLFILASARAKSAEIHRNAKTKRATSRQPTGEARKISRKFL